MRIVGFGQDDTTSIVEKPSRTVTVKTPVRSLVSISFDRMNHPLTYYNDQFDLKPGDRVFVTGKLEGEIGLVESVTTKFRVRISDYQKVISLAQTPIHGVYAPKGNMMLSYTADALMPEDFRKWVLPPHEAEEQSEDDVVFGDGYEIPLEDPSTAEGVDPAVFDRAIDICRSGRIGYVSVRNGEGKAFIRGSRWYELDFTLNGSMIQEAYCECPYAGLCKHLLAVGVILNVMRRNDDIDLDRDFTLISADQFWNMARHIRQNVTL